MSHIHIPDGILPVWLWLAGIIIVVLYFIGLGIYFKKNPHNNKLPLVGVFAALMLIAMSIEIIPIGYHINLAVLSGIIIGPLFSILAIFIVTIILSLVGHGGITVVALNTITIAIEAIVGFYVFRVLKIKFKNVFVITFIATIIALFMSTWGTVGIVYLGTDSIESIMHKHEHHNEKYSDEKNIKNESEDHFDQGFHNETISAAENHSDKIDEIDEKKGSFDLKRFILIVMGLGFIGWILEGFITAFIVNYINKIKPDLLE